jgi:hypothetical protein
MYCVGFRYVPTRQKHLDSSIRFPIHTEGPVAIHLLGHSRLRCDVIPHKFIHAESEIRVNSDPYTPPESQPRFADVNARVAKARMLLAVATCVGATAATMIRISTYPRFGPSQYLYQAFPYLLLIILAINCGRSVLGANISLIGSLSISGCGIFLIYTAGKEIDTIGFTPFILMAGFFVVLMAQLVRRAISSR